MTAELARSCDVNAANYHETLTKQEHGSREACEACRETHPKRTNELAVEEKELGETDVFVSPATVKALNESVAEASYDNTSSSLAQPDEKHESRLRDDDSRCVPIGQEAQDTAQNVPAQSCGLAPERDISYSLTNQHQVQAHNVIQAPFPPPPPPPPPVYQAHQAQFLPITLHGQYQLAPQSFAYPVGANQVYWNQPHVSYASPIVPSAPPPLGTTPVPADYHQPLCHTQTHLIGGQPVYAAPFHFAGQLQYQYHPAARLTSLKAADYGVHQATGVQYHQVSAGHSANLGESCDSVERQSAETQAAIDLVSGGRNQTLEDEASARVPGRATTADAGGRNISDAGTNATGDNASALVAQDNAGEALSATGATDSDTDCQQSQRRRADEPHRQARQASTSVHTGKISYRARSARNTQLEHPAECHFVDKRSAQECQTPTQLGSQTLASTSTSPLDKLDPRQASTSPQEPTFESSVRKASRDTIHSSTSASMVQPHVRASTNADNYGEKADERADKVYLNTCEGSKRSSHQEEVARMSRRTSMNLDDIDSTDAGQTHLASGAPKQTKKVHTKSDEQCRVASETVQDEAENKPADPFQRSTGSHYEDRKQPRATLNKQCQSQTSHISINGTTFYNVPNGVLNRLDLRQFQYQPQEQAYNSHLVFQYPSYHGAFHYYHQQPFAFAYPYYYNNQQTMTFGSHHQQAHQLAPMGYEMTSGFYQSAPVYHAFASQHAHSTAPHQASFLASHTTSSQVPAHNHYLESTPNSGLSMGFSQLKLGYNLIPLLPIDAIPTRIRQAYGMDKVWQDEFEMLFSKFVSSVVWTLVEVETVPNVRSTNRILNYKGRYIVRVGSRGSDSGTESSESFTVAVCTDSSTPRCSSDTDDNTTESASANEPLNDQSSVSDVDEQEPDCSSLDCNDDKVVDSDQGQSDCDSGAILNSSTSGTSESTSHECNGSESSGQKLSPAGSPDFQLDRADKGDVLLRTMSMTVAHGRKFPLRFKMFIDSAKVRFCCDNCGHGWTSMKGRVVFWYELFELIDDGDGISNLIGYCAYKLFGQQCDVCKVENRFERPMWYPEEVTKVLANLYNKIGQVYFGFKMPNIDKHRRSGKPKTSHNSLLCQACHDGVCTNRK